MSHHAHAEIQHEEAEPESFWISVSAVFTVVLLLVVLLGSILYFNATISEEKNAKEETPVSLELQKLRVYESEELNSIRWIDKTKKTVKISIDMAMNNVISSYSSK